jgi:glycerol-3-phosphate O-acyltransferase/dihydroxyacetone phosphate acyltransferase
MFWHFLRFAFTVTINTFYRKIQVRNAKHLRVDKPILIAMNHPNAFMDPIAFSLGTYPPRIKYLARGDAFKEGFITYVLDSLGIVPIYRIQDAGKEGLKKNDETFKRVNQLLGRNEKIIVFAEGLCIQERRLRPIKKGTARMVFGAMEALNNPDLLVVPVGLNYSKAEKFRSYLFCNIGDPIPIRDYMNLYKETPAKAMNQLTQVIEEKMKELVAHLDHKENDEVIEELQPIYKRQWIEENKLDFSDLEDQQKYWKHMVALFNKATEKEPEKVAELRVKIKNYTTQIKKLNLRDHLIRFAPEIIEKSLALQILLAVIGFPFYLTGKILNFIPYKLSEIITKKVVKNIEFYSSVNATLGSLLFFIFYLLELLVVWLIFHNWIYLLAYTVLKSLCGWFALHYSPFRKKTAGKLRLKMLNKRNKKAYETLIDQRKFIINTIKGMPV